MRAGVWFVTDVTSPVLRNICVDKEVDSLFALHNRETIVRISIKARLSINEFSRLMLLDGHSACVVLLSYQLRYDLVALV